jgi:uncharacterized protein (DUF58 family)
VSSADAVASPLRWRPAAIALEGTGVLFVVVAFVLRTPVPLLAGLPLLAAPVVSAFVTVRTFGSADLLWHAEGAGPVVDLDGTLDLGPGGSADGLEVRFALPEGFHATGPLVVERTGPRLHFHGRWEVREPTLAVLDAPSFVWSDPLGLVEREVPGARPSLEVERYPPELLRLRATRLERVRAVPGETRSRRRGTHGEFFGLRDAVPSDSARQINWRATARVGRWLANEFELDLTGDLLIVLDARPTPLGPELDERLLSVGRAACLGVATAFLRAKSRVGYAAYGEFVGSTVPLSTGRIQGLRIRQAVAGTRRSVMAGPGERCAIGLGRFFPRGITTLVVSPGAGDPIAELPPYLRRRGWPVVLLSPSPLAFRDVGPKLAPEDEALAQRLERLERRERLAHLWVHCPVVDWDDLWSLEGLSLVFRRPTRRRAT